MSNTNDYINRGKAINAVHQRIKQIGYDNDPDVLSIRQAVRDVPATDVVEVVRCKDCKHRDPEDKKCDSGHFIQWQLPRDDDWFCADGKRR